MVYAVVFPLKIVELSPWRSTVKNVTILSLLLASLLLAGLPSLAGAETPYGELNDARKAIGRQLVEIQAGNWFLAMEHYAKDVTYRDPVVTIEGKDTMTEFLARMFENSPNLITTIHDESCADGMYSATWTMVGDFGGVPYSADGMSVIKFRERSLKVNFQRDYYTEGDIMLGIPGLDEAIGGFRVYYRCAVDPTYDCPLAKETPGMDGDEMMLLDDPGLPRLFGLEQNVPNPFNPSTDISFVVPAGGADVSLRIYDGAGKLVRTLLDGYQPSGTRTVTWNGTNDLGRPVASGVYYYQMVSPDFSAKKKMVLLK